MSDIDITSDLTDGSDGALGDLPQGAYGAAPAGTQHVHGDARHVNADAGTPKPEVKAEPSLRDQLSSAFKGTEGEPTDQAAAQSAQAPKPETPALTKDGEGKYRMPDGTFASAEQVQAFEAASAAPQNTTEAAASPVLARLTAAEAQQFQSLPAELRQYVERTMEDLNTRASKYSEYDLLEQHVLAPRRAAFAAEGLTPEVAINQLFALSDFAGRAPGDFVMWFSQQHSLDLDKLLDERDAAQANVDPAVQGLQQQIQQLTGTVNQFQQGQQAQAQEANLNAVQSFATERDTNGTLARPYLTDVMDGFAVQVQAVRASNPTMPNDQVLQKAYENACWADPTVRGKMQQAASETARTNEAARVQAAKAAGSSVTGGPAGGSSTLPNNSNRTLREELETAFAAASAI